MTVVRLDDLNVVTGGQRLGRHLEQLERDVDAHAHVGRHDDGNVFGRRGDLGFLRVREAGGAYDQLDAQFTAGGQVRQRAFRAREVDQHAGVFQAFADVRVDQYAAGAAGKRAGVKANRRAGRHIERARQPAIRAGVHRFNQHMAHAATGPGDRDPVRALVRHAAAAHCLGLSSGG